MVKRESKPYGEAGIILNSDERRALIGFLATYILSAAVLMIVIAVLYYNKEMTALQDRCSIEMQNAALMVKQDLMKAEMEKTPYVFDTHSKELKIGLFDESGNAIYSSLEGEKVLLSKIAYKNNKHEYHIDRMKHPVLNVSYVVVENSQGYRDRVRLLLLISFTILASSIFIGFVGYFLSRWLLRPVKARMQHLNNFIKDSSHELNTPISALMMSVSALKQGKEVNPRVINHISISTKLISEIYNSLSFLAFNDRDEVLDETFDLAELVQESVAFFEEIANSKKMSFTCKLEQTMVFMDKNRAKKLVHNLLSNAVKYGYRNTVIQIELCDRELKVSDEGIGIAEDDMENIFTRYQRVSEEVGGFGIGLDIVKKICEIYDIKISVDSLLKKGTTFTLLFPIPA